MAGMVSVAGEPLEGETTTMPGGKTDRDVPLTAQLKLVALGYRHSSTTFIPSTCVTDTGCTVKVVWSIFVPESS